MKIHNWLLTILSNPAISAHAAVTAAAVARVLVEREWETVSVTPDESGIYEIASTLKIPTVSVRRAARPA